MTGEADYVTTYLANADLVADFIVPLRPGHPAGRQVRDLTLHRAGSGIHRGTFRETQAVGPYYFDCALGILTPSGIPVTRTRHLGGFILPPPQGERLKPGKDPKR